MNIAISSVTGDALLVQCTGIASPEEYTVRIAFRQGEREVLSAEIGLESAFSFADAYSVRYARQNQTFPEEESGYAGSGAVLPWDCCRQRYEDRFLCNAHARAHARGDAYAHACPHACGDAYDHACPHACGDAYAHACPHTCGNAYAYACPHACGNAYAYACPHARGNAYAHACPHACGNAYAHARAYA